MKRILLDCFLFMLLSVLFVTCEKAKDHPSDDEEIEIRLEEVVNAENGGWDEEDSPVDESNNPPRPNQFRATIKGRLLSVSADTPITTIMTVRNSVGVVVVRQSFVGSNSAQLSYSDAYSIEVRCSNLTLGGRFKTR